MAVKAISYRSDLYSPLVDMITTYAVFVCSVTEADIVNPLRSTALSQFNL